ncbi:hypothetical protein C8F04DRAFT_1200929 [Mycena alexandri]|uniref:Uncharacterized protein n=1 Tax=Mycena alexandri TaxID=1745969 RepID=A0AAD6S1H4_9AGAR|nr:hypothetical protein C8F04DRAFT_1200929 [Mycena alexandri]
MSTESTNRANEDIPALIPIDESRLAVWVEIPGLPLRPLCVDADLQRGERYVSMPFLVGPIISMSYDVSCKAVTTRKTLLSGSFGLPVRKVHGGDTDRQFVPSSSLALSLFLTMSQAQPTQATDAEAQPGYDTVHIRDLQRDPEYVRIMLKRFDAGGGTKAAPTACTWCRREGAEDLGLFRCRECKGGMPACQECLLVQHGERPTCWPEAWVNGLWRRVSLMSLGYVFQQGHEGLSCPRPSDPENKRFQGPHSLQEVLVRDCLCNPE